MRHASYTIVLDYDIMFLTFCLSASEVDCGRCGGADNDPSADKRKDGERDEELVGAKGSLEV